MSISEEINRLISSLPSQVTLVAVSKTYSPEKIMEAYNAGQRIFGENRPQEMKEKYAALPKDIKWHMIGHLQTNKVKYIAPFVDLIHSVDSARLLEVIEKEAVKNSRSIDCLMEVHVAQEESKHGWSPEEVTEFFTTRQHVKYQHIIFRGIMGMATYTDDETLISEEFAKLKEIFETISRMLSDKGDANVKFDTLSMGMSSDYPTAISEGSTMIRVGSAIFGSRH